MGVVAQDHDGDQHLRTDPIPSRAFARPRSRRGRRVRNRTSGLSLVLTRQVFEEPGERRLRIVFLGDDQLNAPAS